MTVSITVSVPNSVPEALNIQKHVPESPLPCHATYIYIVGKFAIFTHLQPFFFGGGIFVKTQTIVISKPAFFSQLYNNLSRFYNIDTWQELPLYLFVLVIVLF